MTELDQQERKYMRQFLGEHFNLAELKNLTYDLGLDYESFPHQIKSEFCRELATYFERRDNLSCLLNEVIRLRQDDELVKILSKLAPCSPRQKVQIVLSGYQLENKQAVLASLAQVLGVELDEVMLVQSGETQPAGCLPGLFKMFGISAPETGTPLLVGLPAAAAVELLSSDVGDLDDGRFQVRSITSYAREV
ncbi:MAG: hypothetical protein GY803_28380 [Chloroflexi bacterium]|nr:hypothetical protein [Chloroflexota bacterium]